MLNALFVLIIFLMQLNQDVIHIEWPFGMKYKLSFDESNLEVNFTFLLINKSSLLVSLVLLIVIPVSFFDTDMSKCFVNLLTGTHHARIPPARANWAAIRYLLWLYSCDPVYSNAVPSSRYICSYCGKYNSRGFLLLQKGKSEIKSSSI